MDPIVMIIGIIAVVAIAAVIVLVFRGRRKQQKEKPVPVSRQDAERIMDMLEALDEFNQVD